MEEDTKSIEKKEHEQHKSDSPSSPDNKKFPLESQPLSNKRIFKIVLFGKISIAINSLLAMFTYQFAYYHSMIEKLNIWCVIGSVLVICFLLIIIEVFVIFLMIIIVKKYNVQSVKEQS